MSQSGEDGSKSNWWGSWINAAKSKSSEVLDFVKKDIEEIVTVVNNEASHIATATSSVLEKTLNLNEPDSTANTVKRSFSTFLGQVSEVFNPSPDDSGTETIVVTAEPETKLQRMILHLQEDDDTYLTDPDAFLTQQYYAWLDVSEEQFTESNQTRLLVQNPVLADQHKKLVQTDQVPEQLFWRRYLFKKAYLEDTLAMAEAEKAKESRLAEEDVKWEQEDFANDVELTEEQQIKLLEQYENEKKTKTQPSKKNIESEAADLPKAEKTVKLEKNDNDKTKKPPKVGIPSNAEGKSSTSSSDGDWEKLSPEAEK